MKRVIRREIQNFLNAFLLKHTTTTFHLFRAELKINQEKYS